MLDAGRSMGLDVGTKTIGVAISDELGLCAYPKLVLRRQGDRKDLATLAELARAEAVVVVVVGWPLALDGKAGPRARRVEGFAQALGACLPAGTRVELWDERFSTAEAERVLIEGGASRARRKAVIDKQAAALILQGWLDRQRGTFE